MHKMHLGFALPCVKKAANVVCTLSTSRTNAIHYNNNRTQEITCDKYSLVQLQCVSVLIGKQDVGL